MTARVINQKKLERNKSEYEKQQERLQNVISKSGAEDAMLAPSGNRK
jgi:hypothetical protein